MIITLEGDAGQEVQQQVLDIASHYPSIETRVVNYAGRVNSVVEILLLGDTKSVPLQAFEVNMCI